MSNLGEKLTDKKLNEMVREVGVDGAGRLNYAQLCDTVMGAVEEVEEDEEEESEEEMGCDLFDDEEDPHEAVLVVDTGRRTVKVCPTCTQIQTYTCSFPTRA